MLGKDIPIVKASTLPSDLPTEGVGKEIQPEIALTYDIESFGSPGSPPSTPSDVTDSMSVSSDAFSINEDVIVPESNSEIQRLREKCKVYTYWQRRMSLSII